jgi:hypothetical protein
MGRPGAVRLQNALGNPVPARWVGLAARLAAELAADAGADLVHADLHYGNVLAGTRQCWLAIDPKAIAGDPELSVPELMWTRLDEAENASDIRALLAALTHAAAMDPAKAKAWTIVRAVDYWLWAGSRLHRRPGSLPPTPRHAGPVIHGTRPSSINANRRRIGVSMRAIDRPAVFMVPMRNRFSGRVNSASVSIRFAVGFSSATIYYMH